MENSLPGPSTGAITKNTNGAENRGLDAAAITGSPQDLVSTLIPYDSLCAAFDELQCLFRREERWPTHFLIHPASRASVLNRLLKIHGFGGSPAVIHTATWYWDSTLVPRHRLAMGSVSQTAENLHLFGAACYSIARKIHGLAATAEEMVAASNYAFTAAELRRTEALIHDKMKPPAQPVIPQVFITYFSLWCDKDKHEEIESAATFLCMSGLILDRWCLNEYPSVMGVAAVRNALCLLKKFDLLYKLEKCPLYRAIHKKMVRNMYRIQRDAVCKLASPVFEYTAPLYSGPVHIPRIILRETLARLKDQDRYLKI